MSTPRDREPKPEVLGINRRNLDLVFADYRPGKFRDLDDKLLSKARMEAAGVPVPPTVAIVRDGSDLDRIGEWLADRDEIVVKPAKGWGGRGILVLERDEQGNWRTPGGRVFEEHALRAHVAEILTGAFSLDEAEDRAILEERIHAHPFLDLLYPDGLSDLRVVVEDGVAIQAMLRVPTRASDGKANLHGGGLGLGVDVQTGRVVSAIRAGKPVDVHPDTNTVLVGLQVPDWDACIDLALAGARAVEPVRYVGLDIVLDARRGPLVLEVNARPGLAIQLANQSAQPVRRRTHFDALDRFTQRIGWAVLLLLVLAPWGFQAWQEREVPEVRAVRAEGWQLGANAGSEDVGAVEWSDEADEISGRSEIFARARAAVSEQDTARALLLYGEAALDSTLMPFALNNMALIARARGDLHRARTQLEQAVLAFPGYARGHYNLGLILRDSGELDEAETAFRRSLDLRPSHARSWSEWAELMFARGELDSAQVALEQAVRFDPDTVGDRRRLARVLLARGRPGAAATRYAQALALAPNSESSATGLVDARLQHAALRRVTLDAAALDSLRALLLPLRGPRSNRLTLQLSAELDWWSGDALAALDELRTIALEDLDSRWLTKRALLAVELGHWDEARACVGASASVRLDRLGEAIALGQRLESFDPAIEERGFEARDGLVRWVWQAVRDSLAPDTSGAFAGAVDHAESTFVHAALAGHDLGGIAWEPGPARARRLGTAASTPIPGSVLLWALTHADSTRSALDASFPTFRPHLLRKFLAAAEQSDLDPARADRAYTWGIQLLRSDAGDAVVILALARIEIVRGQTDAARALFERLDPAMRTRLDAQKLEARLWIAEGQRGAARRRLTKMAAESPLDAEAWSGLAEVQTLDGRREQAVDSWQRVLQILPDDAHAREQLARSLMDLRRYDDAAEQWQLLRRLDLPAATLRSVLYNHALALQRLERIQEALEIWDEAIALSPGQRGAVYNRALALERLGRTEEAIAALRLVLEIDPDHEPSRTRLARLTATPPSSAGTQP